MILTGQCFQMFPKRRRLNTVLMVLISFFAFYLLYKSINLKARHFISKLKLFEYKAIENEVDDVVYDYIDDTNELEVQKRYEFPYKFLLDEPSFCRGGDLQVVNIIPVRVSDRPARDGVRRTWGLKEVVASTKLKPLFLIGASRSPEEQQSLERESQAFHDIIQIDVVDSYLNLTLKTLTALHWKQGQCQHVPWLLKSDADVFLHPWAVTKTLSWAKKDFVCKVLKQRHVCRSVNKKCRDGRWVMPREIYPHDRYPPYCNGPAYALSQRAVREVLNAASFRKMHFAMEDIYFTGILPQGLNLQYYDVGSQMCLYHLETPPYDRIANGNALFIVDSFGKSRGKYTHDDLWRFLNVSRFTSV
ncbi:beta-1,3-galactosyltransferase 1-like [Macrobrachium nipponense]|uniref:beta-1,3-galactosyltransferase 1-like n=1 Tax=Macrobrachium nipponense TaxID=159736 RepID=UPI0030C8360B